MISFHEVLHPEFCIFPVSSVHVTFIAYLIPLLIANIIWNLSLKRFITLKITLSERWKLWRCLLLNFLCCPVTPSLLGYSISSARGSQTQILCFLWSEKWHFASIKRTNKIIILYLLIICLCEPMWEDKTLLNQGHKRKRITMFLSNFWQFPKIGGWKMTSKENMENRHYKNYCIFSSCCCLCVGWFCMI